MSPQRRRHFAIIVHYGEIRITKKLVDRLQESSSKFDGIVVIDHGPQSEKFTHPGENIRVIRPEQNNGYGGGIEVGLGALFAAKAEADDIITVMNNDIEIGEKTIRNIKAWWAKQNKPTIAGARMGSLNLKSGRTSLDKKKNNDPSLKYLHGSLFCAPYHIMQNLRVPQHYFMYWEDVFFSNHALKKGIELTIIDNVEMDHNDTKNPPSDNHLYYLVRNGASFLEKETPSRWRKYWWARNRLRLIYHTLPTNSPRRHIIRKALLHAVRGKTGQVEI